MDPAGRVFQQVWPAHCFQLHELMFYQFKPACVDLSREAINHLKGRAQGQLRLTGSLRTLYGLLMQYAPLESRLADYCFFPLSYVFRGIDSLSPSAVTIAVQCLEKLVLSWTRPLDVSLSAQILTLLCRILGKGPEPLDHECLSAVFECIRVLVQVTPEFDTTEGAAVKAQIGQVLDSALTVLATTTTPRVQSTASGCILEVAHCLETSQALLDFLPGIFSRLTVVLVLPRSSQRQPDALSKSFKVMAILLEKLRSASVATLSEDACGDKATALPNKVHAANIRAALKRVFILQFHDKDEVVEALFHLILVILRDRDGMLGESADMALDTALYLCGRADCKGSAVWRADLLCLFSQDHRLLPWLAERARGYIFQLHELLSSTAEASRSQAIARVIASHSLLLDLDWKHLAKFEQALIQSLLTCLGNNLPSARLPSAELSDNVLEIASMNEIDSKPFDLLLDHRSSGSLFGQARELLMSTIGTRLPQVLDHVLQGAPTSTASQNKVVVLWLSSRSLEYSSCGRAPQDSASVLHDLELRPKPPQLYFDHAIEVLSSDPRAVQEWRLEGLALEVIAFHAEQLQRDFRLELADALFPILKRLASDNEVLRRHAARCLHIVSQSCGYSGPAEALLQNADYLVNVTALQLNTLDVGPQALRALSVLLHLGGQRLIPYLEDLVESLLSILSTFHGYSRLVEQVLVVLNTLLDQVACDQLEMPDHSKEGRNSLESLLDTDMGAKITEKLADFIPAASGDTHEKRCRIIDDPEFSNLLSVKDPERFQTGTQRANATAPTTFKIVKTICQLAKHFLSHPSFKIRQQTLHLLRKTCTVLSGNKDDFLPTIHEIWPGMLHRLDDSVYVVEVAAIRAMTTMIRHAGAFLSSRVEGNWSKILQVSRAKLSQHEPADQENWSQGSDAQSRSGRLCVVDLLLAISNSVRLRASMKDDLFSLLEPLASQSPLVRDALPRIDIKKAR